MASIEILLKLKPEDAIVRMLNDANNTTFPLGTFNISSPIALTGRDTKVTLSVRKSRSDLDVIPYTGSIDFIYQRLRIEDSFADLLRTYRPDLPTSTQVVLNEITKRLKSNFFIDDIILEEVTKNNASNYLIKAKEESLRWIGQIAVSLVDLINLDTLLTDALPKDLPSQLGVLNEQIQLSSFSTGQPFIDATQYIDQIKLLALNEKAQDDPRLAWFVNTVVPLPSFRLDNSLPGWVVSNQPQPFNLYNAKVLDRARDVLLQDRINPNLNKLVVVELDLNFCTNLTDPILLIPYGQLDLTGSEYSNQTKLTRSFILTDMDASAYSAQISLLNFGDILDANVSLPPMSLNDSGIWEIDPTKKTKTNLFGSVVVYNGLRRAWDPLPANPLLDKVLILLLGEYNSAYKGNMAIPYS